MLLTKVKLNLGLHVGQMFREKIRFSGNLTKEIENTL